MTDGKYVNELVSNPHAISPVPIESFEIKGLAGIRGGAFGAGWADFAGVRVRGGAKTAAPGIMANLIRMYANVNICTQMSTFSYFCPFAPPLAGGYLTYCNKRKIVKFRNAVRGWMALGPGHGPTERSLIT